MVPEIVWLAGTAATIAFVHTLLGPDHYLPFIAVAKASGWSSRHTLVVSLWRGVGHLLCSLALGIIGIYLGSAISNLMHIEAVRGTLATWFLCGSGMTFLSLSL